jgi:hypothetical protein
MPEPLTPEATLVAAFDAVRANDLEGLVALSDRASVEAFRHAQRVHLQPPDRQLTPSQLQRATPGLSSAEAQRQVTEWQQQGDERRRGRLVQFGVASPEEFDRLSAPDVMRGALRGLPDQVRELLYCHPLGYVPEGPNVAHVLFRWGIGPDDLIGEPHIATCRLLDGEWRLVLEQYGMHSPLPGFRHSHFQVTSPGERAPDADT